MDTKLNVDLRTPMAQHVGQLTLTVIEQEVVIKALQAQLLELQKPDDAREAQEIAHTNAEG